MNDASVNLQDPEFAVLQGEAGQIGEAQVAAVEDRLGQHRSPRERLGEGRLPGNSRPGSSNPRR